jgi:Transcriptional regulatory protein, C terminal
VRPNESKTGLSFIACSVCVEESGHSVPESVGTDSQAVWFFTSDLLLIRFRTASTALDRRQLRGAGGVIHVEPQAFDLLLYFAQNPNRVISKNELIEQIWEGRVISDATLNGRMNSARRAVGDTGKKQALIRTVQRRGFLRFALPGKPSIAALAFQNLSGGSAAGILRRRHRRGHPHGAFAHQVAVRRRAQFEAGSSSAPAGPRSPQVAKTPNDSPPNADCAGGAPFQFMLLARWAGGGPRVGNRVFIVCQDLCVRIRFADWVIG